MNIIQMMFWLIINKLINNIFTMKRAYHIIIQKAIAEINKFCQKTRLCEKDVFLLENFQDCSKLAPSNKKNKKTEKL